MPSPFPGMDPYLERHWWDLHTKIVSDLAYAMNDRLPQDLIARAEERVAVESGPEGKRSDFGPDVRVFEAVALASTDASEQEDGTSSNVALAPMRLRSFTEPITERFIKILDADSERLITVIEVVSPTNKTGRGLREFRRKRAKLINGDVNVVEVDLVRSGDWQKLIRPHIVPREARTAYRTTIRVGGVDDEVHLHPMPLREPLPTIRIPLRKGETPLELPLQPLLDRAYDGGRYARTIDYAQPCDPPLNDEDAAWADELLKGAGKR